VPGCCYALMLIIEQDYHELKHEFGLSHYEGRGWIGFHHHATVCIAAYGFLTAQRLKHASKKNSYRPKARALPEGYKPRGSRPSAAACCPPLQALCRPTRSVLPRGVAREVAEG
jgi:hypothetical protein